MFKSIIHFCFTCFNWNVKKKNTFWQTATCFNNNAKVAFQKHTTLCQEDDLWSANVSYFSERCMMGVCHCLQSVILVGVCAKKSPAFCVSFFIWSVKEHLHGAHAASSLQLIPAAGWARASPEAGCSLRRRPQPPPRPQRANRASSCLRGIISSLWRRQEHPL